MGKPRPFLARLSLWIDFGFMISYGAFLALAALAIRDFARERGLLDAAENIAWLLLLNGHGRDLAAGFGTACASLKFLLVGLAILYAILGLVA